MSSTQPGLSDYFAAFAEDPLLLSVLLAIPCFLLMWLHLRIIRPGRSFQQDGDIGHGIQVQPLTARLNAVRTDFTAAAHAKSVEKGAHRAFIVLARQTVRGLSFFRAREEQVEAQPPTEC